MIKVIIVDDDFLVRSYLKQLKAWEDEDFLLVGEARDGEEALTLIRDEKPDLILTDITMPVMDGIELIRQIKQDNLVSHIVVLSCHDDFEYVREALKLGADEYVLKNSLSEESLKKLLKTVKDQYQNNQIEKKDEKKKEKLIKLGSQSLKVEFFNQLLAGGLTGLEKALKAEEAGIVGRFYHSVVIAVSLLNWKDHQELDPLWDSQTKADQLQTSYKDILKQMEEGNKGTYECIYLSEGYFCIFLDLSEETSQSMMQEKVALVVSNIEHLNKSIEDYEAVIGISQICTGIESLRKAYLQSREAVKYRFYCKEPVLYYKENRRIMSQVPIEAQQLQKEMAQLIASKQKDKIKESFDKAIELFRDNMVDGKQVIYWFKELDRMANIQRDNKEFNHIYEVRQLMGLILAYEAVCQFGQDLKLGEDSSSSVQKAVEYIRNHYQEPINLENVADNISLNSAYLSFLFKQETGINFSSFLLSCRLDCAKGLLKTTDKKVKDIASLSGFNDYRYFCKTFKKMLGVRPADYRKGI